MPVRLHALGLLHLPCWVASPQAALACNRSKARAATLQTDLNRLENVKVCAIPSGASTHAFAMVHMDITAIVYCGQDSAEASHSAVRVYITSDDHVGFAQYFQTLATYALVGAGVPALHSAGQGDGGG